MSAGDRVRLHNGASVFGPEPATLVRRLREAHPLDAERIEVWEVRFDADPARLQVRGVRP